MSGMHTWNIKACQKSGSIKPSSWNYKIFGFAGKIITFLGPHVGRMLCMPALCETCSLVGPWLINPDPKRIEQALKLQKCWNSLATATISFHIVLTILRRPTLRQVKLWMKYVRKKNPGYLDTLTLTLTVFFLILQIYYISKITFVLKH